MQDQGQFCVRCGEYLSDKDVRCPVCGKPVPGREGESEDVKREVEGFMVQRLNLSAIMMALYGIPYIIYGIWLLVGLDSATDWMINGGGQAFSESLGLTEEEFHALGEWMGFAFIASGAAACVTAYLCHRRTHYWVAVVMLIISMFSGVTGFLAIFLSLFVFWMLLGCKPAFKGYEHLLDNYVQ